MTADDRDGGSKSGKRPLGDSKVPSSATKEPTGMFRRYATVDEAAAAVKSAAAAKSAALAEDVKPAGKATGKAKKG